MPTASQVASWIVVYRAETSVPVDPMSLQKLVYYAQAFHLARHGRPLFSDTIKAWRHGPVVPDVWHRFPANEAGIIRAEGIVRPQFDPQTEECLREVAEFFSLMSATELSGATHNEDPWKDARGER